MLVKEPECRITLPEIISHPWFQKDLPPGFMDINQHVNPAAHRQSEAEIVAVVKEAQVSAGTHVGVVDNCRWCCVCPKWLVISRLCGAAEVLKETLLIHGCRYQLVTLILIISI